MTGTEHQAFNRMQQYKTSEYGQSNPYWTKHSGTVFNESLFEVDRATIIEWALNHYACETQRILGKERAANAY